MEHSGLNVISPELIKQAFVSRYPHPNDVQILSKQPIFDWDIIVSLDLSSLRLSEIAHLGGLLNNLKSLKLSQNNISRIENLERLIKLERLDLGFNQICKIENLEKLTALTFLRLSDNKISVLENLEANVKLHTFHIDRNQITDIGEIFYLKRFKSLRNLDLRRNPFAVGDYLQLIINQLPELEYLNYKTIENLNVERPTVIVKSPVSKDARDKYLRDAFLNDMDGNSFIDFLLKGEDYEDLTMLIDFDAEVSKSFEEYKIEMSKCAMEVMDTCLNRVEVRHANDRQFRIAYFKFEFPRTRESRKSIQDYNERKRKFLSQENILMSEFQFKGEISRLCDNLHNKNLYMNKSIVTMIDKFEEIIKNEIETTTNEIKDIFFNMNSIQEKFNHTFQSIFELSMNNPKKKIPDEYIKRFNNRSTITQTVDKIGQLKKVKIFKREQEFYLDAKKYQTETIEGLMKKEKNRFSMVIEEIRLLAKTENEEYKHMIDVYDSYFD